MLKYSSGVIVILFELFYFNYTMLRVQKVGQWVNPKRAAVDSRSILPLTLRSYISSIIPIIPMGLTSYGQFISDTAYTTNPGAALTYTSSSTSGMTLASSTEIRVANAGDYLVNIMVNYKHTGGGVPHSIRQWIQVNGTDVALSATEATLDSNTTGELPINSQFILTGLSALDRIKVWYANTNISVVPTQQAAVTGAPTPTWQYNSPAVPAAIVTVLQLST